MQGTVDSGAWTLEYTRDGASDQASWVAFASGNGSASGVLGRFDPTVLLNGSYVIRLSSTSQGGSASAQLGVVVQKNLKIGNVALAFIDATVAAGLPISIVRSYDSRDTTTGDFGAGWNLSLRNVRVEKTVVTGKFWQETQEGYFAFPSYCLRPTRANVVSIIFPNGKLYRFAVEASPQCQPLVPIDSPQISLTPLPGTVGQLPIADAQPTAFVRLNGGIPWGRCSSPIPTGSPSTTRRSSSSPPRTGRRTWSASTWGWRRSPIATGTPSPSRRTESAAPPEWGPPSCATRWGGSRRSPTRTAIRSSTTTTRTATWSGSQERHNRLGPPPASLRPALNRGIV